MNASDRKSGSSTHQPVLYQEIIHALNLQPDGRYVDCTVGGGGHAVGILEASAPNSRLLGLDLDPEALGQTRLRLAPYEDRVILVAASYTTLRLQLQALGWDQVEGVLLDLGLSTMQLEDPMRGFSFQVDGPLDMRFDPAGDLRAEDLVNGLPEAKLADILFQYGEERRSRQVARAIVNARPLYTTVELAAVVSQAIRGKRGKIHPATRTFQALRIAVNRELEALETVLPQAIEVLAMRGRLAIISFHSLEDRLVKVFFQRESRDCICPPNRPVCDCEHRASIRLVSRRPIVPTAIEIQKNPRSRSAKLRVAEKIMA